MLRNAKTASTSSAFELVLAGGLSGTVASPFSIKLES